MKNMIKVLPELDVSNMDTYIKAFCEMMECARTTNDIPDSIEDYFHIDYMDRKMLMKNNIRFFNEVMRLMKNEVDEYVNSMLVCVEEKGIDTSKIHTLDDLLNCGYYGKDYESSRREFANCFVEDVDIDFD